jgi:signal transduction histidine kinase/DNA-binding NarL/FixJ family response regulator/HPt (histidine-containing phosphotransfer) domain-containing protein/Tfp pilus assembly protein PilF
MPATLFAQDQHYFDSLHSAYAFATQDTERSDLLLKLATALADADTATAMSYALQSYDYAKKAGDDRRVANVELFEAHQFSSTGLYDSARARLLHIVRTAESLKDSTILAQAYSQLGWNDLEIASYDEALEYFQNGLDIVQRKQDSSGIGNAYDNLGCLYLDQQEPENALKNLRLALAYSSQTRDIRAIAAIYNNIGLSYNGPMHTLSFDARLDSALLYFRRSAKLYESVDDRNQLARILGNIGSVFEKKVQIDSALYYDRQSVYLHESLGLNSTYVALAYEQLGNLFLLLHHSDSAFHYLNIAQSIDEGIGAKRGLVDLYMSLGKAYASTDDYKSAYEYFQKSSSLHDSIYSVDKSRILADMEAKYQMSKNERKIASQNEQIAQDRLVNYSIIGIVVVLCLVAFVFYRNDRKLQRINKELAAAKERAEASERLEHQFLANMSHEIRTPMNAVLGMTTLLLDTPLNQKQRDYLEAIHSSADNLLVVINDILDLSKLQAGKMEFERIPFRLQDVTGHALEIMRFKAEAKGLVLSEDISESTPKVILGDPARLSQVLMNLLSNAVKFTDTGSVRLIVSAVAAGDRKMNVRLAVRDTGIGIPKEKLKSVFDSFSQADAETSRKYGGTGLGLTISRNFVELQGGHIDVTSEPGKGSEFSITMPFEVASETVIVAPEETASLDAASLRGMRVLLVEDNEYNQIVLGDTLHNMIPEVSVEIASNGREAITLLQNFAFDLVLMDVQMPEMDGIEATKYIRAHLPRGKREVPIIALTASVIKSEIDRAFAAGMNDYVPKPFKQDELFRVIAKYFKGRSKHPALADSPDSKSTVNSELNTAGQNDQQAASQPQSAPASTAPAAVASATPVTDLSSLKEITGGNDEQLKKYIRMFLDGVPSQLESVGDAIAQNDLDNARRKIHAMKPHLKFMGMKTAAGFAETIEQLCADHKDPAQVSEKFALVRAHCEQAIGELRARL